VAGAGEESETMNVHYSVAQSLKKQFTRFFRVLVFLVGFCFLSISVNACSSQQLSVDQDVEDIVIQHPSFSEDVQYINDDVAQSPSQVSVGLIRLEDRDTPLDQLPQNREFRVAEDQSLSLGLILFTGQDAVFLVTALLDYQQIPFTLDGKDGLLHEVEVEAGKDLFIPVQVDVQGAGAHDLLFVAFRDPDQRPLDHDFRTSLCRLGGFRSVVIVGEDEQPVRTMQPDAVGVSPPPDVDWGPRLLFAEAGNIHPSQPDGQMKMVQQRQSGDIFDYSLWMSNVESDTPSIDYGLVRFLNYRQIDFKGKDWFVAHLDENQEMILNDSLVLPTQSGINELQIIYVYDPYKSLLRKEVTTPFIYASDCLGIETQ
jgi:hypothetical protein